MLLLQNDKYRWLGLTLLVEDGPREVLINMEAMDEQLKNEKRGVAEEIRRIDQKGLARHCSHSLYPCERRDRAESLYLMLQLLEMQIRVSSVQDYRRHIKALLLLSTSPSRPGLMERLRLTIMTLVSTPSTLSSTKKLVFLLAASCLLRQEGVLNHDKPICPR